MVTKIRCHTVDFYQHVRIPTRNENHPTTTRVSDDYNLTKDLGIVVFFVPEWGGVLLEAESLLFPVFVNASNVKNMFLDLEKKNGDIPAEVVDNSSLPKEIESKKKIGKPKQQKEV